MKFSNIKITALLLATVVVAGMSCKKNDFAINTNPNDLTTTTVDYQSVLPASLASSAKIIACDWKFLQNWMGWWARSGSYQDQADEETYNFTNDFPFLNIAEPIPLPWNDLYYNATNYDFLQKRAHKDSAGFYEAIARIMKAQDFQMLVDVYGNVPYSEAFQGNEIRTPKYDKGIDIYKDLLKQLDTAITLLHDPVATSVDINKLITTNDLVFKGNATSWIKYANTLKLRLLMHLCSTQFVGTATNNSVVPGIDVAAEVARIVAEGSGFLGKGQTAKINPGYNDTKPNPWYRFFYKNEKGIESSNHGSIRGNYYALGTNNTTDPGYYGWNGDPRRNVFYIKPYTINPAGDTVFATTHRGMPYGELAVSGGPNQGNKTSTVSEKGYGVIKNGSSSDAWLFTSMESLFLQAEAVERGFLTTGGSAQTLLTSAVQESFSFLGLNPALTTAYFNNNSGYPDVDITQTASIVPGEPGGGIYTILSQKWFALNGISALEVWTDYRRSDIVYGAASEFDPGPAISVNPANSHTTLPVRLFYPQNEYNYNSTNVANEGNINVFTGRIFWDLN